MDNAKKGGSVSRPPVLDGPNYDFWKFHMVYFLKSMDKKTWKVAIKGWTPQNITTEHNIKIVKFEKNWSAAQDKDALGNSCALNSIYIGGNKNIFMIIYT